MRQSHRLDTVKTYYFATKLAELETLRLNGVDVINLGIGSPDLLPAEEVIDTLKNASNDPLANKYQSYKGLPELRNAFSEWYSNWFNVAINPNSEILPLLGSKEGIMHISMSYLNPGDEVLVPNPGYPSYGSASRLAGAEIRYFDLLEEKNWKPDLESLEKTDLSKVKLMWVNYPNMPTGADVDLAFYSDLVAFGLSNDILICNDNPYTFILNDNPKSIFQIQGSKTNLIELTSLSKNYNMAGWRIGAIAAEAEIINTVLKFKSNMDSGMYKALQLAAVKALSLGEQWFSSLNAKYLKRKRIAEEILSTLSLQYNKDQCGMFLWAKVPEGTLGETMSDRILKQTGVFITPGFIFGSKGNEFIRISLCSTEEVLSEALARIKNSKQ